SRTPGPSSSISRRNRATAGSPLILTDLVSAPARVVIRVWCRGGAGDPQMIPESSAAARQREFIRFVAACACEQQRLAQLPARQSRSAEEPDKAAKVCAAGRLRLGGRVPAGDGDDALAEHFGSGKAFPQFPEAAAGGFLEEFAEF